ncbi:MAG: hypothetical protein KAH21_04920 [Spirochaetaceae bacterium]|nr:hypothetical protein [Spirochaetaceae bacterium]
MPQEENEKKKENDESLRRFIDRLENWPEDEPPSPAELRALRRDIHLTEDDREKLELLAENHIRRARTALEGSAYDQAAAELARAAQLRPMDPRPRVELAGIYLQRSLERGYRRNDRQRALKLAHKALELHPGDMDAKQFLHDYRRMNADFLAVKYRRYIIPTLIFIGLITLMLWWQRDWVLNLFNPISDSLVSAPLNQNIIISDTRDVEMDTSSVSGGIMSTEIISSYLGRKNDGSFVDVRGRLNVTDSNLGKLKLLLRGRDAEGNAVFTIPWTVRNESDPVLIPGDSEVLVLFRWLAEPENSIVNLELVPYEMESALEIPIKASFEPEVIWETVRPEGSSLSAEIRGFKIIEAYDRQVLLMDLAMENTGITELSTLTLGISLGSDLPEFTEYAVKEEDPGIKRGERRVWSIAMRLPLDADLAGRPITINVKDAGG